VIEPEASVRTRGERAVRRPTAGTIDTGSVLQMGLCIPALIPVHVPENWHRTMPLAVARWQLDLKNRLSARHPNTNQ